MALGRVLLEFASAQQALKTQEATNAANTLIIASSTADVAKLRDTLAKLTLAADIDKIKT